MAEDLAEGVREVLADHDVDACELSLSRIPGGASRETWLVEGDDGASRWVLRRDPKGSVSLVPIAEEFALIDLTREGGVPVPEPLAFEPDRGRFGSPGMLMSFVEGTSVGPRILRKPEFERARSRLPGQLAEALARVHAIEQARLRVLPRAASEPALSQIEEWERQLDEIGEPLPAVEIGLRWLRANVPSAAETGLVHGDFRLGTHRRRGGLAAVIDWELAHLGDPAEDIGWLCIRSWRFGNDDRPVAGLGALEEFIAAYEAAGGAPRIATASVSGRRSGTSMGGDLRPPGSRPPHRRPPQP
jgi:aminoglycoside phosphotransferase (APT) family kinase protein